MVKVFGPQQTAWIPRSSWRAAGLPLTNTSGEPVTMGPTAGCGQAGHPCASASTCALSPRRAADGIQTPPNGVQDTTLSGGGPGTRGSGPGASTCKPGDVLVEPGTKLVAATDELNANSTVLGDMDHVSERRLSRPSDRNGEFKIDDAPGGGK